MLLESHFYNKFSHVACNVFVISKPYVGSRQKRSHDLLMEKGA